MPRAKSGSFDQGKYIVQYMKENIKHVKVSLNKNKPEDAVLIEWLNNRAEGASAYIKDLIRADIERGKVGRWIPCRVEHVKDTWEGHEYSKPVFVADESIDRPGVVKCSVCGAAHNVEDADDECSYCHHEMIPFLCEKWQFRSQNGSQIKNEPPMNVEE